MYEENYNENFEDFLDIFPETIQKILKKRTLKETNFQDYLYDIDDSINAKNYFGFLKKLFWISDYIDGYFLYLLNEYISRYKNINFNPTNQNIKFLFKNIIEFNSQNLFISDLIKYMKINHSFPLLYIFEIYKVPLRLYIKSCYEEKNYYYSQWADLIEEDFKILDNYLLTLYKNDKNEGLIDFKFKITKSIFFIIKVILKYCLK